VREVSAGVIGHRLSAIGCLLVALAACARPSELAVMSFNIRYGTAADGANAWPNRRELVIGTIRAQAPDVLGLQEALRFQLDELGVALPEYGQLGVGRDDGRAAGEYAAILYRRDRLEVEASGTFWLSDTPEVPGSASWGNRITRVSTWARFRDRATAARLAVFNAHLDHESQSSREHGVRLILGRADSLAAGLPVVFLGDFNAGEDNPAIVAVRAAGFADTYRVLRPDDRWAGSFSGFVGDSSGPKIDYIFARGEWDVRSADVLRRRSGTRDASDHFPIVARIRVTGM
jgi:endonuclease/exonuclease/phosphatase family metal-dependent hydrolase